MQDTHKVNKKTLGREDLLKEKEKDIPSPMSDEEFKSPFEWVDDKKYRENISGIPVSARYLNHKARSGNCSPRQAIKAKCQECTGFEEYRERIANCQTWKCPLWQFRPYRKDT